MRVFASADVLHFEGRAASADQAGMSPTPATACVCGAALAEAEAEAEAAGALATADALGVGLPPSAPDFVHAAQTTARMGKRSVDRMARAYLTSTRSLPRSSRRSAPALGLR